MENKWGIPSEVEQLVQSRDTSCVYCGVEFKSDNKERKFRQSWEHIVNDIGINSPENIALCCVSCNASKGAKKLKDWLKSKYCESKNITSQTVAQVVKDALNYDM